MSNTKIQIYTSTAVPNCPSCKKAKTLLENLQWSYDEIVIGRDLTKAEFQEQYGLEVKTVPQIIINGNRVGGLEDLKLYVGNVGIIIS